MGRRFLFVRLLIISALLFGVLFSDVESRASTDTSYIKSYTTGYQYLHTRVTETGEITYFTYDGASGGSTNYTYAVYDATTNTSYIKSYTTGYQYLHTRVTETGEITYFTYDGASGGSTNYTYAVYNGQSRKYTNIAYRFKWGNTILESGTKTLRRGQTWTVPAPIIKGYTFNSWGNSNVASFSNTDITGYFVRNYRHLTINAGIGGKFADGTTQKEKNIFQYSTYGSTATDLTGSSNTPEDTTTRLPISYRKGYTFIYKDSEGNTITDSTIMN